MIRRLQTLRFVAAALVLVGHTLMEAVQHSLPLGPLDRLREVPWGIGVDIFFVISGFIICTASIDRPNRRDEVGDFLLHRLLRIWPTYATFSLLMLVPVFLVPSFLKHSRLDPAWVAASFAFLPWPRPDDGRYYPLLGQGWTLNYEMFFYLSFAAALFLPPRRRVPVLVAGGLALAALGALVPLPGLAGFYAHPVILEFLYGVLLSVGYRRARAMPWLGAALIAVAALVLATQAIDTEVPSRFLYAGVPAAMIVGGVLLLGEPGERWLGHPLLVLLGNASYALYLCHTFVINAVAFVLLKVVHDAPAPLFMAVAFVGSAVASVVAYRVVERPFLRLLKPRIDARRRVRAMTRVARPELP